MSTPTRDTAAPGGEPVRPAGAAAGTAEAAPPRAPGPATTTHRHGRLGLTLERRGSATVVAAQDIVFPSGTVRIADVDGDGVGELQITNPSGGLLAGDRMDTLLTAGTGTRASVVTQGANRVCGAAVGLPPARTELHARMTLEGDAVLEWAPHHLVPYARAAILQRTAVDVAPAAGLLLWETLSAGRSGRGERFAWDRLDVRMRITRDRRPLLHDGAVLGPGGEPFDGADLVATVVVVLPVATAGATTLADDLHRALGAVPGTLASASAVDDALVVGRVVARDATALYRALHAARVLARPALGLPPPRRPIT